MDTVTIDGVEYVKASVLAKRHKYTADYVGQLCRSRKVDAHLVGRTWYVYPPSLEGHKTTRYAELRSGEKSIHNSLSRPSTRVAVPPPVSKQTVKSVTAPHFANRVAWQSPAYEEDDAALVPELGKKNVEAPIKMKIGLAESERVRVASRSKNVTMVSQPLPAIALAGTLKVLDYEPTIVTEELPVGEQNSFENTSDFESGVLDDSENESRVLHPHKVIGAKAKVRMHRSNNISELSTRTHEKTVSEPSETTTVSHLAVVSVDERGGRHDESGDAKPPKNKHELSPFTPKLVAEQRVVPALKLSKNPPGAVEGPAASPFFRLVIAPALIIFVLAAAALVLSLEAVTVVGDGGLNYTSLRLQASTFDAIFGQLFK